MKRLLRGGGSVLLILVLFLLPLRVMEGCGYWIDRESTRIVYFDPYLGITPELHPYVYIHDFYDLFNKDQGDPEQKDYWKNCAEWASYVGKVTPQDVFKVIYETEADQFLSWQKTGQLKDKLAGNPFITYLLQAKNKKVLDYLTFAFKAEFSQRQLFDPWSSSSLPSEGQLNSSKIATLAINRMSKTKDPFLHERYAFQALVHTYYAKRYGECLTMQKHFFGKKRGSKSILKDWTLIYKANSHFELRDTLNACISWARAFDRTSSKKFVSHLQFPDEYLDIALKKTTDASDRSNMIALCCIDKSAPILNNLVQLVNINPNSKYLPLLLSREINKVEEWMLTPQLTFYKNSDEVQYEKPALASEETELFSKSNKYLKINAQKNLQYLAKLQALIQRIMAVPKQSSMGFWHFAAAHTCILSNDIQQAKYHLNQVKTNGDPKMQYQKTVQELLILPDLKNISYGAVKNEIAGLFNQLLKSKYNPQLDLGIYPKLLLYYSRKYQGKKDVVTAGLFYNRARYIQVNGQSGRLGYYSDISYFDRFASLGDLDILLGLHENKPKTPFVQFLLAPIQWQEITKTYDLDEWQRWTKDPNYTWALPSRMQLLDLKGTIAFRQRKYVLAWDAYKQMSANYWEKNYEFSAFLNQDPFGNLQQLPWESEKIKRFNKAKVLQRWIELGHQMRNGTEQEAAQAHYLLANAHYNTTYWGQNWMMFSYGQSLVEPVFGVYHVDYNFSFMPNGKRYYSRYYALSDAIWHYEQVLRKSKDRELNAKAIYMLGHCDELRHEMLTIRNGTWKDDDPYKTPYYKQFKRLYQYTKTFRTRLTACPELKDYF
jgi:hypothetical protein